MNKRPKSLKSDRSRLLSPANDIQLGVANALRQARHRKRLSQAELAHKLGLRQRQISDLERAITDSRLSTIQNVARALDLELIMVPRHLISAVEALQRAGADAGKRPLYALDDETEDVPGEAAHVEVGDSNDIYSPTTYQPRARKGSRR